MCACVLAVRWVYKERGCGGWVPYILFIPCLKIIPLLSLKALFFITLNSFSLFGTYCHPKHIALQIFLVPNKVMFKTKRSSYYEIGSVQAANTHHYIFHYNPVEGSVCCAQRTVQRLSKSYFMAYVVHFTVFFICLFAQQVGISFPHHHLLIKFVTYCSWRQPEC